MTWEAILPALMNDPIQILRGTFLFVIALLAVPPLLSKVGELFVSIIILVYHLGNEINEYFLPSSEQLDNVLRRLPSNSHQESDHDHESRIWRFLVLTGRIIDRPSYLSVLLREDFGYGEEREEALTLIRSRFKLLFLTLAIVSACLVAYCPPVAAFGLFGLIGHTLVAAGISPGLLLIGKIGTTFGIIYGSRTFVVAFVLLMIHYLRQCFGQQEENQHTQSPPRIESSESSERKNLDVSSRLTSIEPVNTSSPQPANNTLQIHQHLMRARRRPSLPSNQETFSFGRHTPLFPSPINIEVEPSRLTARQPDYSQRARSQSCSLF